MERPSMVPRELELWQHHNRMKLWQHRQRTRLWRHPRELPSSRHCRHHPYAQPHHAPDIRPCSPNKNDAVTQCFRQLRQCLKKQNVKKDSNFSQSHEYSQLELPHGGHRNQSGAHAFCFGSWPRTAQLLQNRERNKPIDRPQQPGNIQHFVTARELSIPLAVACKDRPHAYLSAKS